MTEAKPAKRKVFGVGFHRTGTTTLQTALEEMGYRVIGMRDEDWDAYERGDFAAIRAAADAHDGFRDMPWPMLYRELDAAYPDARFVLTYRERESWIRSCQAFFKAAPYRMFRKLYGVETMLGNEDAFRRVYDQHLTDVRDYFAGRPDKFLEIEFAKGEGWDSLCDFLGEPRPQREFPKANLGAYSLWAKVKRKLLYWFAPDRYYKIVRDKR